MWSFLANLLLLLRLVTEVKCQDKSALPAVNFCVLDDGPAECFIDCLIEKVDRHIVEETLLSVKELFPDSTLLETLRCVCKANNDESQIIIDAIADHLSDEELTKAVPIVWECHDTHLM